MPSRNRSQQQQVASSIGTVGAATTATVSRQRTRSRSRSRAARGGGGGTAQLAGVAGNTMTTMTVRERKFYDLGRRHEAEFITNQLRATR